ncbi:MAG: hypothetical protein ACKPKO_38430 [Candidatus Fonsibacter sp.]
MGNYIPEHMELLCRKGFIHMSGLMILKLLNHVGLPEKNNHFIQLSNKNK